MIDERFLSSDERAIITLRALYHGYGYAPFKMSKFEEYDLYVKNKDFLISDRVITFNDTNGKLLALKPDVTLSIIKNAEEGTKTKVYYNENVYRISGSTGHFKEIMQTGLECIGDLDASDVYEVLYLAAKSLESISDNFVLDISHMGLLSAILDDCTSDELFKKEITPLIARKSAHEAKALCERYGVSSEKAEDICSLISLYGDLETVIPKLSVLCKSDAAKLALSELEAVSRRLATDFEGGKVRFDISVVNNMSYYDGIVFSGFLSGICEAVLSGGQYGKILASMGKSGDAVGFALYLDLLSELDTTLGGIEK
jgi:ATP phosphoribosyltransferase regulatory subunit